MYYRKENRKSQAILELGIFSAILFVILGYIVSYGQQFNYQQSLQMRTQQRVQTLAWIKGMYPEKIDPTANLVAIEDRAFANASDPLGIMTHRSISASANMTWSNALSVMEWEGSDLANPFQMPHVMIAINQTQNGFNFDLNSKLYSIATGRIRICDVAPEFAGFGYSVRCPPHEKKWCNISCVRNSNVPQDGWRADCEGCFFKRRTLPIYWGPLAWDTLASMMLGWPARHWYWQAVWPVGIPDTGGLRDAMYFGVVPGYTYDIDGDGEEETVMDTIPPFTGSLELLFWESILAFWENFFDFWLSFWNLEGLRTYLEELIPVIEAIDKIVIIDNQEGELDASAVPEQGIQGNIFKRLFHHFRLEKNEGNDIPLESQTINGISTFLTRESTEKIYRWIRLSNNVVDDPITYTSTIADFFSALDLDDVVGLLYNLVKYPVKEIRKWAVEWFWANVFYLNVGDQVVFNNSLAIIAYMMDHPELGSDWAAFFATRDLLRADDRLDEIMNCPDGEGQCLRIYVGFDRPKLIEWHTPWQTD